LASARALYDTLLPRNIIKRPFKKQLQWSKQAMLDAMKALQDGSPITTAARVHGVSRTSLRIRIKGRVVHGVKCFIFKSGHVLSVRKLKKTCWLVVLQ